MLVAMLLIIFLKTRPADTTSESISDSTSDSTSDSNSENKYVISTSDTKN